MRGVVCLRLGVSPKPSYVRSGEEVCVSWGVYTTSERRECVDRGWKRKLGLRREGRGRTAFALNAKGEKEQARYRLVLYHKPGCEACDVLKRKVNALIDRAQWVESTLSEAMLEERDINDDLKWLWKYGGSIPELGCIVHNREENEDEEEVILPRVNYRDTTDSIGKQIEQSLNNLVKE